MNELPMCKYTLTFLFIKQSNFLSILGENFLGGLKWKHPDLTIYFPSSSSNQTHSKKTFFLNFSPKFSIHPISPPNKHTLRLYLTYTFLLSQWLIPHTLSISIYPTYSFNFKLFNPYSIWDVSKLSCIWKVKVTNLLTFLLCPL